MLHNESFYNPNVCDMLESVIFRLKPVPGTCRAIETGQLEGHYRALKAKVDVLLVFLTY